MSTRLRTLANPGRLVASAVAALALALALLAGFDASPARSATTPAARALVLYDTTGPYAWLGELYAMNAANLAGHFGRPAVKPVAKYVAGDIGRYDATIYVGSTYDEPLPTAFLDDVLSATKPVVWMNHNIWQLTARDPGFTAKYGWNWRGFDTGAFSSVVYKGTTLERNTLNAAGVMDYTPIDPAKATVLAEAVRPDGSRIPWALRSGSLTYVGEIPFSYVGENDRALVFSDLLFDALAPATATRHRGLVRIEDVGPDADPAQLRRIADYLYSKKVPFSVATYPVYRDPRGVAHNGVNTTIYMRQRPLVVSALKYMQARGGTIIMHGYTHQYGTLPNPYDGQSGNDFEFYLAHVDASNTVVYDGPVPGDSKAWARGRMTSSALEFALAGLGIPNIFEFPHYAGSAADYAAVREAGFAARYERGLYFSGQLAGGTINHSRVIGQFFPYGVTDINGSRVIPENLGNYEPSAYNNHPARTPAMIVDTARRNLVIRDGVASFFYHPYLADACATTGTRTPCIDDLKAIVEGIQGLGYTFVAANSMLAELPAAGLTATTTALGPKALLGAARNAKTRRLLRTALIPAGFGESDHGPSPLARRCARRSGSVPGLTHLARAHRTAACLARGR